MRALIIIIIIAASFIGCASKPKSEIASDIPFPTTTDFDDNAEARAAYMTAFENGYRAALRGQRGVVDTFGRGGRRGIASEIGYMRGQIAADYYMAERDLQRSLEESRRLRDERSK
jgi:hypothetical protein